VCGRGGSDEDFERRGLPALSQGEAAITFSKRISIGGRGKGTVNHTGFLSREGKGKELDDEKGDIR